MNNAWIGSAGLGFEIAAAVFLGAFIGYKINVPWGLIIGVILGAAAGFWNAYKMTEGKNERT
ncbi:MAG: AtpZ/AtpI family protein [bacterium]